MIREGIGTQSDQINPAHLGNKATKTRLQNKTDEDKKNT